MERPALSHQRRATIRPGTLDDAAGILVLYRRVAETPGGIARSPSEVTSGYVEDFLRASLARGIVLVAEVDGLAGLAGELHAYRSPLQIFRHVLGELTVAVHPETQGRGIGRQLFEVLLETVRTAHPDISRVELITQETNHRALRLYEGLGFQREGRLSNRIMGPDGSLDADIPLAWLR